MRRALATRDAVALHVCGCVCMDIFVIMCAPLYMIKVPTCKYQNSHFSYGVFKILLVLSIPCYFHYNCMCSTSQFHYRWLKGYIYRSCHYHDQIGSIRLFHCYHIFPWLCAWDVYYIIFCHLLYIHSFNLIIIIVQTYLHWTPDVLWCLALSGHLSSCTVLYLPIIA